MWLKNMKKQKKNNHTNNTNSCKDSRSSYINIFCESIKTLNNIDVLKRDNFTCQICGRTISDGAKLEVDHRVPVAKGGKSTMDNLWTLCFECNRGKSTKK